MVSAGEPLDPETIAAFKAATGLEPADGYGQTETGHVTANLVGEPVRQGSMGKPLPGMETRIVEGELQLRAASSPTFFSRYLDGERFEGEWWQTGDLVREDDEGYLESALLAHPAVADAAAVAAPDPERGSVVRAIVVLRDPISDNTSGGEALARELQEHCKRETAPYKFPRIVEFADELPKTSSGKIKRAQLRAG
jgi:acyl-coenzyme A synthetase/AMP-(fatty) acid ligase